MDQQGYKITLKNMEVFGASNFQVKSMKLSENGEPFEAKILLPKLKIEAKYTSSGVLLIIPALVVVISMLYLCLQMKRTVPPICHVDSLSIVINVDKVNMMISNAFNNNRILLFLNSMKHTLVSGRDNGRIVLDAMQSQLQKKLAMEFGKLANKLFEK
ncbi:hypothetical protein CVS40_4947 [Lucilia cuprina]|nr:hypothetical protein CVS40_4947 [Lucilia cuprina]